MTALCAALEPEFGTAKIFRPYRDVRFAKDKTPYKTHQGAFVRVGEATGWYVEVSPRGVRTGAGFYDASSGRLAAFRAAVAHDRFGPELEGILRHPDRGTASRSAATGSRPHRAGTTPTIRASSCCATGR